MRPPFDLLDASLVAYVAEGRSLTHAAERAHLSLPAASMRIRNLEEALGVRLLHRTHGGVTLTEAGKKFVLHAKRMLEQLEALREDMREYALGSRGSLRVYATTTAVTEFLPPVLGEYLAANPEVRIDLVEQKGDETVSAIREGSADIGVISNTVYSEGLHVMPYRTLRLVLVAGTRHPLAGRASVRFAETLDFDYVGLPDSSSYQHFMAVTAASASKRLSIRMRVNNFEAVCRMAELNIGLGLIPECAAVRYAASMNLRIVPLADAWAFRRLLICVRSADGLPPFAQELTRLLLADAMDAVQDS